MTVCYLTVAVVLFAAIGFAAAEEFPQSLPKFELVLGSSESTLAWIDVRALSVQYREGQIIEDTRTRALEYVQVARTSLKRVRSEARMYDLMLRVTSLRGLDSQIEILVLLLANLRTLGEHLGMKTSEGAQAVSKVADSLTKAIVGFEDEAFQFAGTVDSRLASCSR